MKIRIFSAHHQRPVYTTNSEIFVQLWTKGIKNDGDTFIVDSDTPNLSRLVAYNDLRQQFYAWRHLIADLDYVGFEHYRRIFVFDEFAASSSERVRACKRAIEAHPNEWYLEVDAPTFADLLRCRENATENAVVDFQLALSKLDVVVPRAYRGETIAEQWEACGYEAGLWDCLMSAISKTRRFEDRSFDRDFRGTYYANIYVLRKPLFISYMEFWSEVMFNMHGLIDLSDTSRMPGYLSERIFNFWLRDVVEKSPHIVVKETPFVRCGDFDSVSSHLYG